jgi:outer membrane immunogenic protein
MKKSAIALAPLGLLVALPAGAADMRPAPVKAPAPVVAAPAFSWTGCYVGAGGGYGMYNQDSQLLFDGQPTDARTTNGGRGWFATVQVGCDYQVAPTFVIGAFGDYDWSSIKGDSGFGEDLFGREKLKASWAVGGRIGYLPFAQQQLMVFVSGGYTQAKFGAVTGTNGEGNPTSLSLPKHTYSGWFIGSGYEYAMIWFPGLTWKTEYRFADYGQDTIGLVINGVPDIRSVEAHKYVHTVRSTLTWRFNLGGPVVARY